MEELNNLWIFLAYFSKFVMKKKNIEKDRKMIEMNQNINQLISKLLRSNFRTEKHCCKNNMKFINGKADHGWQTWTDQS